MNLQNKINVGIIFGNYGPYHHARVGALQSYTKNLNFANYFELKHHEDFIKLA